MSIPDMLGGIYNQTTDEEWLSQYSTGWLLAHYLAFEPTRRGQTSKYVDLIQKGVPALDAAKQSFGDLKQLEKDLNKYRGRDTLPTRIIPASMITVGPVEVRTLQDDEEAILPVRMKLEAQMENSATARSVAGPARSTAKKFPQSELVMEILAQAELQGKRYEEASIAADQALALNPKAFKPLIYKGRAQMEIAKQNPKSADWKAIRTWFARANRQDLNSPEPLMYYYQTFLEEGVTPPAQAVDGLLFAVELVPQDDELRLMAVRQLVRDGDLANAKDLFAPIAYSPHFPKEKHRNLEIMDKVKAGDGKAALAMLEEDEKKRQKAKR
jgi:tetratricopeptide (TPR) repeat protein